MAEKSAISWTDATWNPWQGCRKVSAGCKNCYMFRDMARYGKDPSTVVRSKTPTFNKPLSWTPRVIFTCSWSDWFIEDADAWRDDAWEVVRSTPQHLYLILTKRPELIAERLPADWGDGWPHVWLGVSAEDQRHYDERVSRLLAAPAAHRFVSAEPLLDAMAPNGLFGIDWIITGGESGPGCRPLDLAWVRRIRDLCSAAVVMFHHKQHGGTAKIGGTWGGRELDGRVHDDMPSLPA